MSRGCLAVAVVLLLTGSAPGEDLKDLRVCADPDNLPFSNQQQQGFENKIAEVIARDLGVPLAYYWWPHQRGLVRNTLRAEKCDVLINVPKNYDLVLATKPYFRSAYVLIYAKSRGYRISSLDDPLFQQVKIGVHGGTPPQHLLAERGIIANVVTYSLYYDFRDPDPQTRPIALIDAVLAGRLDVGIVWGPWAGYAVKKRGASDLEIVPLSDAGPIPVTFEVSMGVKRGAKELKTRLEEAMDRRQAEIRQILDEYGVPILPLKASTGGAAGAPGSPGGSKPPR